MKNEQLQDMFSFLQEMDHPLFTHQGAWTGYVSSNLQVVGRATYAQSQIKIESYDFFSQEIDIYFTLQEGKKTNEVLLSLTHDSIGSECNCEMKVFLSSQRCPHEIAAVIYLEKLLFSDKAVFKGSRSKLDVWLSQIEQVTSLKNGFSDGEYGNNYKSRTVYVLKETRFSEYYITPMRGLITKSGTYKISSTNIKVSTNASNRAQYVSDLDLSIIRKFQNNTNAYHYKLEIDNQHHLFAQILEECCATGRCLLMEYNSSKSEYSPLTFGEPVQLNLGWELESNGKFKPVTESSKYYNEVIHAEPLIYVDKEKNTLGLLQKPYSDEFLDLWRNGPSVSEKEAKKVTQSLQKVQKKWSDEHGAKKPASLQHKTDSIATRDTPEEIQNPIPSIPKKEELKGIAPTPILNIMVSDITPSGEVFLNAKLIDIIHAEIQFDYAGHRVIAAGHFDKDTKDFQSKKGDALYVVKRDKPKELECLKQLKGYALQTVSNVFKEQKVHSDVLQDLIFEADKTANKMQWIQFIESNQLKELGWQINVADLSYTVIESENHFETLEENDNNWFDFNIGIEHEGKKISLIPAIAAAINSSYYQNFDYKKRSLITIPLDEANEQYTNFPAQRFKSIVDKVRDLFQHINNDGVIEMPRLRAATLVDDLSLQKSNQTLQKLAELGKQLNHIKGIPKTTPPKNLNATLRDYQVEGFRWLQFLSKYGLNGVLADDMGLGKTVQTLAHILAEKNKGRSKHKGKKIPSLVVVPTSLLHNWKKEAEQFTPSLKVLILHGTERKELYKDILKYDIIVTTYALIQKDEAIHKKQHYHLIILDESQYIKNTATKTTKSINTLHSNLKLCLSGTPMENHLGELWSLFNFLMPGLLQTQTKFNAIFKKPIEKESSEEKKLSLSKRVTPLMLRRTKDKVAKDLPPKTIIPHYIPLSEEQIDLYESVRAAMDKRVTSAIEEKGMNKSHILILDALLKLRQICCHPQLLKNKQAANIKTSSKLNYLTDLLAKLLKEGRRILIFSQFTSMLSIIEKHLKSQNINFLKITGATQKRQNLVDQFQTGEIPIFLISLKAGGTGLNLTAADTVIHYDPWWNPAAENQATDRAYRIGQDKPVFVHKLICQGSIEEQIQTLQQQKAELVDSLLSKSTNKLNLDAKTLSNLLAPISE